MSENKTTPKGRSKRNKEFLEWMDALVLSILVLVFVVLGGLGNMLGSIVAAAALTILPEALREFADYRMLVYAIVLILVMLATYNPTMKNFVTGVYRKLTGKDRKEAA